MSFTPSDSTWNVANSKDALNDLYSKAIENTSRPSSLIIPRLGTGGGWSDGNHHVEVVFNIENATSITTTGTSAGGAGASFSATLIGENMSNLVISTNGTTAIPDGYQTVLFVVDAKSNSSNSYSGYFNQVTINFI